MATNLLGWTENRRIRFKKQVVQRNLFDQLLLLQKKANPRFTRQQHTIMVTFTKTFKQPPSPAPPPPQMKLPPVGDRWWRSAFSKAIYK